MPPKSWSIQQLPWATTLPLESIHKDSLRGKCVIICDFLHQEFDVAEVVGRKDCYQPRNYDQYHDSGDLEEICNILFNFEYPNYVFWISWYLCHIYEWLSSSIICVFPLFHFKYNSWWYIALDCEVQILCNIYRVWISTALDALLLQIDFRLILYQASQPLQLILLLSSQI